jgi:hypothetical protein
MKLNIGESITAGAVIVFGAVMAYLGSLYPLGSLNQMGPGYFPVMLGAVTVLLGLATLVEVHRSDTPAPDVPWGSAALILAGILVWAMTAERFGLVPATFALVFLSSMARPPIRIVPTLVMAAIASVASVLVFLYGFALPLRAFNW